VNLPGMLMAQYRERLEIPGPEAGGPNDIRDEMPYLLGRAQSWAEPRILEIGVRSGNSTSAFLAAAARGLGRGHVWSVDVAEPAVPPEWHTCGYWTFRQDRSLDVTPELAGWPASFHVLFLDGDHSRAGVLAELRKFVPYVAAGGVVLCHDTKLVNEQAPGTPREVAQALDWFCGEYHLAARRMPWMAAWQLLTPQPLSWTERGGWYGLGVIESPNG